MGKSKGKQLDEVLSKKTNDKPYFDDAEHKAIHDYLLGKPDIAIKLTSKGKCEMFALLFKKNRLDLLDTPDFLANFNKVFAKKTADDIQNIPNKSRELLQDNDAFFNTIVDGLKGYHGSNPHLDIDFQDFGKNNQFNVSNFLKDHADFLDTPIRFYSTVGNTLNKGIFNDLAKGKSSQVKKHFLETELGISKLEADKYLPFKEAYIQLEVEVLVNGVFETKTITVIPDVSLIKYDKKNNKITDIIFLENKLSPGTRLSDNQGILRDALDQKVGKITIKKKQINGEIIGKVLVEKIDGIENDFTLDFSKSNNIKPRFYKASNDHQYTGGVDHQKAADMNNNLDTTYGKYEFGIIDGEYHLKNPEILDYTNQVPKVP